MRSRPYLAFAFGLVTTAGLVAVAAWWYSPEQRVARLVRAVEACPGFSALFSVSIWYRPPEEIDRDFERLGERAVAPLVRRLDDPSWGIRQIAARQLGSLGRKSAAPALVRALSDPHGLVRQAAAGALGDIGDNSALPALLQAMDDSDPRVRWAAAGAMGNYRDARAVERLVKALSDDELYVRALAAEALGEIRAPAAVGPLAAQLNDPQEWCRREAAVALAKMGHRDGVPQIVATLNGEDGAAPPLHQRMLMVRLLGDVGDPRAGETLKKIEACGDSPELRAEAARALSRLAGSPRP